MPRILLALLVTTLQIAVFHLAWSGLVKLAAELGRHQRGGVAFGVTVHYSGYLLAAVCLLTTLSTALIPHKLKRHALTGTALLLWCTCISPTLAQYPIRGTTYLTLGIIVTLTGSAIISRQLPRV